MNIPREKVNSKHKAGFTKSNDKKAQTRFRAKKTVSSILGIWKQIHVYLKKKPFICC